MDEYLVEERDLWGGEQKLYRFKNGYGASVVKHSFSYGSDENRWELPVIIWESEDSFELTYNTPITDDVIGHLTDIEVEMILENIRLLNK